MNTKSQSKRAGKTIGPTPSFYRWANRGSREPRRHSALEGVGLCWAVVCPLLSLALAVALHGPGPLSHHVSDNDTTASFTVVREAKSPTWRKIVTCEIKATCQGYTCVLEMAMPKFRLGSLSLSHALPFTSLSLSLTHTDTQRHHVRWPGDEAGRRAGL